MPPVTKLRPLSSPAAWGRLRVDHRLPGRLRFRVESSLPPQQVLDAIARTLAREVREYELRYNPRSRRYRAQGPRGASLEALVHRALSEPPLVRKGGTVAAGTATNTPQAAGGATASRGAPARDEVNRGAAAKAVDADDEEPWVRRASRTEPRAGISAARIILPEVARFLLMRPLVPPPLRPFLAARQIWPHLRAGLADLGRGRLSVAALDASAIGASVALGQVSSAQTIAFLLGLGNKLERWTRQRTRDSLAALYRGDEAAVWVLRDGVEAAVEPSELAAGDQVVIRAGSRVPVDGVVREGEALVNQASMTGEAMPVRRAPGLSVYAGTVVTEGRLVVQADQVGDQTRFSHIVRLLESSDSLKAEVSGEAERMAEAAVPWTFLLSAAVLGLTGSFVRAASVLVVDYSCALKLATPLAVKSAMIEGATRGAMIKGGRPLERLARADAIVLDKTGTLTQAKPRVVEVLPCNGYSPEFVLRHAACLEEHFPHPVATAVVQAAREQDLHHEERHADVEYLLAHGIASSLEGESILVGSRHFVHEDEGVEVAHVDAQVEALAARGYSVLYVSVGGALAGLIAIEDPLLEDAPEVVERLWRLGARRIVLITGDNEASAREVAGRLGLHEVHAEVLPDDKVRLVQQLQSEGHRVVMVGDGMNDSAALAHADVGVSVAHGADVAREACDVLLIGNRLADLPGAIQLAQGALGRTRTNFWVTVGANTALIALGLTGLAPAALLAVLHNASTLAVCTLAMRPLEGERS